MGLFWWFCKCRRLLGAGGTLHLWETTHYKLKVGLGRGTNNYAKLNSLRHLLLFALEKHYTSIQIFGDSQLIINWINGSYHYHVHTLRDLLDETIGLKSQFESFVCCHIYKERNEVVDFLSKEAAQLIRGKWIIQEYRNGHFFQVYHTSYIERGGLSLHQSTFWGLTTLFSFHDCFLDSPH